jgi:hypothetical protein
MDGVGEGKVVDLESDATVWEDQVEIGGVYQYAV